MPSLGADMDAGTIVEWRVGPGDAVRRGDIVAVVATEKADIDVEVFESGVVEALLVPIGVKVPVGTPLAVIGAAARAAAPAVSVPVAAAAPPLPPAARAPAPPVPVAVGATHSPLVRRLADRMHVDVAHVAGTGPGGAVTRADVERAGARHRASPRARRLAGEAGIDLGSLTGSGPGGAVVGADVLAARPAAPVASKDDRAAAMRQAIARQMARSAREIPHYHLATDVDLSVATAWLAAANEQRPVTERLLPAALLLKATALAAGEVAGFNGWCEDETYRPADGVHLATIVSLRSGGLVAPVIHDAAALSIDDVMATLRDLVQRARSGHLRASDVSGASLTVTNLGDLGVDSVHGVIHPPQVALVGFGRVAERPWVVDGAVVARSVVTVTLAADHRVSDGMQGARFLDAVTRHLQRPEGC